MLASWLDMSRPAQLLVLLRRALPLLVIAGFVGWSSRGQTPTAGIATDSKLPELSLTLSDGSRFSLPDSPQVVVLNFWASYCPPCREEAPVLSAFQAHTPDVKVVGLTIELESPVEAANQAQSLGMHYAIGVADQPLQSRFRVQSIPTTYVIAKGGKIVFSHTGPVDTGELTAALADARHAG